MTLLVLDEVEIDHASLQRDVMIKATKPTNHHT
jgi:hypothetical protein